MSQHVRALGRLLRESSLCFALDRFCFTAKSVTGSLTLLACVLDNIAEKLGKFTHLSKQFTHLASCKENL